MKNKRINIPDWISFILVALLGILALLSSNGGTP